MGKRKSEEIKKLIEKIREFKKANKFEKVILFGSYARGDFDENSDVDLVIADKKFKGKNVFERSKGLWIKWHVKQKIGKPVDFLCYTPEEFNKFKKEVSIVSEALKEGIEI
ncbi:MAG: nucleotidyltransferase domain-containing protein [Candidatus Aenigmatarchaeota archaeon]